MTGLSPAGSALVGGTGGFGLGTSLSQQVQDETEDEKRKKRLGMSMLQSPAGRALAGGGAMLGF
jgi:hypothetical protein